MHSLTKRALIDPHGAGPIVAAAGYDTTIPVYLATPLATEGAEAVAYLHDLQPFAEDEALAVCNKVDPGAFPVYTHPPRAPDREKIARIIDPDRWACHDKHYAGMTIVAGTVAWKLTADSLAKADEVILALINEKGE